MKNLFKLYGWAAAALLSLLMFNACNPEPKATDLEFSYPTFDCEEGEEGAYISVYLMQTPYKFPVVVDMEVEMVEEKGKDAEGNLLSLDDVIEFIETDQTYNVTKTSDRTATIENVQVTYSAYNQKVYFNAKQNDFLQEETIEIKFTLTRVDGSEMGNVQSTILTIVDDEKAPLLKVGYYDAEYTAPEEATRPDKGSFYMRLQKVGKYNYVASEWFGLPRPRLYGTFDSEKKVLTFDGTDYDHKLWAESTAKDENPFKPVSAFQNDTIWANAYDSDNKITQVLLMRGAGADGLSPIVISTEEIAENAAGVLLSIDSACGFYIYPYDATSGKRGSNSVGIYDAMESSSSLLFSKTNYEDETRSGCAPQYAPIPFGGWVIE